ncbi:MAG: hypothetical protein LBG45_02045 [Dysgonamonadaceae bacterium]|jgi:hypothetical protein|nr:hypothetical protein [Dysgonamonadaceae bacterium]
MFLKKFSGKDDKDTVWIGLDHFMLTAMEAVRNIREGITGKDNVWAVNTETEYHEEMKGESENNKAQKRYDNLN